MVSSVLVITFLSVDVEVELKDTTDTVRPGSYLDIHLENKSEGMLRTQLYDKRDYFNFLIVNFPFIWSNVPATSAYGLYISQLIRYSRACGSYHEFLDRRLLLTRKSLNQGFLVVKLKSPLSLKSFTVASTTWLTTTEYLCHKWPRTCSVCRNCNMILSSFITYYRVCNKSNTTVATYGTGNAYPLGKTEFTPGFLVWFVLLDL